MFNDIDENKLFHSGNFAYINTMVMRGSSAGQPNKLFTVYDVNHSFMSSNNIGIGAAAPKLHSDKVTLVCNWLQKHIPNIKLRYKFNRIFDLKQHNIYDPCMSQEIIDLYNCTDLYIYTNYNFIVKVPHFHFKEPGTNIITGRKYHSIEIIPLNNTDNKIIRFEISNIHDHLINFNLQQMIHPCVYIDYLAEDQTDIKYSKLYDCILRHQTTYEQTKNNYINLQTLYDSLLQNMNLMTQELAEQHKRSDIYKTNEIAMIKQIKMFHDENTILNAILFEKEQQIHNQERVYKTLIRNVYITFLVLCFTLSTPLIKVIRL